MAVRDLGNIPDEERNINVFRANEIINRMEGLNVILGPIGKFIRTYNSDYLDGEPTNSNAVRLEGENGVIGFNEGVPVTINTERGDTVPILQVGHSGLRFRPLSEIEGLELANSRLFILGMKRVLGRRI